MRRRCYTCKFGGEPFKVGTVTHLHCFHKSADPNNSLREFWQSCRFYEEKPENPPEAAFVALVFIRL